MPAQFLLDLWLGLKIGLLFLVSRPFPEMNVSASNSVKSNVLLFLLLIAFVDKECGLQGKGSGQCNKVIRKSYFL